MTRFSVALALVLCAGLGAAGAASAQSSTDSDNGNTAVPMGPGMMGYGQGYGMGPGIKGHRRGGYGGGYGMMGGGYGMGMGMGPGMMGGGSGYGMGPGMMGMGGYGGGCGMGPGMMGGGLYGLDLSAKQRGQIIKIYSDMHEKHWAMMQAMHQNAAELHKLYAQDPRDPKAIGKVYGQIFDMQRQMIEDGITTQNQVNAILTKEQREQLREQERDGWGWRHPRNRR